MSERVLCVDLDHIETSGLYSLARELAGGDGFVATLSIPAGADSTGTANVDAIVRGSGVGLDARRGDHVAAAIVAASRELDATVVLSGPSKVLREALARAGAILDGPSLSGVHSIRTTSDGLEVTRDLLSGNASSIEIIALRPALLSLSDVPSNSPASSGTGPVDRIVPVSVPLPSYPYQRISFQPRPEGKVNLEEADRIVSIGRGLQRREDLALIVGLAKALGAAVGCTRPLAADSGWLGDDHWVGLTGHRVRPTLYVAIGISGAPQHLVGMRDSKVVVAINNDANAPIFQQADFQVVGDLYAIVPELTRRLGAPVTASS